ncbi:PEP/pyruvate-binding domain-containing protein [Kineococcus indalonis]|uniref:PEP/pyruvate-binding domain-containing protein n=1 Tax=Kineococcus indalonis TaxID=2696566 RepID=UPI001411E6B2|nr:PEP/pyruvate-binding domain-containing protein [Kineococcus indalonis]NAZ84548.1 pyruvate kinase [Kineococcus indalonis]
MLVPLEEADERCGGKAANLARLVRAGFDVPPGVVVTDPLGTDGWVGELAAVLRRRLAGPVAVRSSALAEDGAEASFAGQLHTALEVTDPAEVVAQVRRAAASGTGPGAVAYAARLGRQPAAAVPVVVQAAVPAEVAGAVFTRHPLTGARQVVVEAARGPGEAVVGGTVTPWTWTVEGGTATCRAGARSRPLTPAQVLHLAGTARRVEEVFGCPQDVEWAIAGGTLWLLQSRPVTTPGLARRGARARGRLLARGTAASPGTAEGPARVVEGLDGFARFAAGEVLVCRTTSPAWTPLLARAAAVVTETGGLLAHAAIVAREFGVPAVLAVPGARGVLTDGRRVVVDGSAGTVAAADPEEDR